LATEIEQEIQKLEAEQLARQEEVQQLEKELGDAQAAAEGAKVSSGAAFVPPTGIARESGETIAPQNDLEIIDDGDSVANGYDENRVDEPAEDTIEDETQQEAVQLNNTKSNYMAAKNETSSEDFTLSAVTFEIIRAMVKQVESDVKRIVELIAPVIQPILRAGDVAWRHLKVAFESMRKSGHGSGALEAQPTTEMSPA
jgi:chromosome segregation ATPase